MQEIATETGLKNSEFFMLLRVGVTGKKISPPLNESMELLGKNAVLERLGLLI
jgi:glutamyl-tRNA synthetase